MYIPKTAFDHIPAPEIENLCLRQSKSKLINQWNHSHPHPNCGWVWPSSAPACFNLISFFQCWFGIIKKLSNFQQINEFSPEEYIFVKSMNFQQIVNFYTNLNFNQIDVFFFIKLVYLYHSEEFSTKRWIFTKVKRFPSKLWIFVQMKSHHSDEFHQQI